MKTIISLAFSFVITLVIGGFIFTSMAFRNPYSSDYKANTMQFKDTFPRTNLDINIDVQKALEEANKAIASIDFSKIMNNLQLALKNVDMQKIQLQVEQSLKKIDFAKMQKDIDASLKNIDWSW